MRKATLAAFILLSCLLSACTISDGGIPRPYTRSIGPNGGTIADPAGATLIIPAGALAENTRITVTTYQDTLDFGTAYPVLAGALFGVRLEPEGLEFAAPVTLQIAPTATLTAGDEYPAFWYDAAETRWEQTGHATVAAGGAYVETTITHFSDYSIFDMPYDVLDDFDEYVAEHPVPDYSPTEWGELYIQCELFENESFVGPDQYYNGCCYMRNGADVQIDWTYEGVPHTYGDRFGSSSDDSYTLSYSYSSGTLTYSIVLTVYLSCSQGETNVWISSVYDALEVGERSEVYGTYLCGEGQTPIAGRIFTFSLSGPGRLSRTTAVTDEEGEARIEYIATAEGTAVITATMEGCLCNAQLDLNPLVTTIVVGESTANLQHWGGTVTINQSGRQWGTSPGSAGFNFQGSAVIDFTFVVEVTEFSSLIQEGTGIGIVNVSISGESASVVDTHNYDQVYTISNVVAPGNQSFTLYTPAGTDHLMFIPENIKANGTHYVFKYDDRTLWTYTYSDGTTVTALDNSRSDVVGSNSIFIDRANAALVEGTETGTSGEFLNSLLENVPENVPINWTLELHRID